MNLLRRLASLPGLRSVLLRPGVRRRLAAVLALRFAVVAWSTTTPYALLVREYLTGRGRTASYTMRGSGMPVVLVHGRDLEALHETFHAGEYLPPPALEARLAPDRVHRVVDVGANIGMFSAWAATRWPQAEVLAFEPAPSNIEVFRRWQSLAGDRVRCRLEPAAAGVSAGTMVLRDDLGSGSRAAADDEEGVTVPVQDLLPHLVGVDLVKIDIEGGEWPILADPRLAGLDDIVLVMEYHRLGAPSLPALDAARGLLEAAGFETGHARPNHWGHGILWAAKA